MENEINIIQQFFIENDIEFNIEFGDDICVIHTGKYKIHIKQFPDNKYDYKVYDGIFAIAESESYHSVINYFKYLSIHKKLRSVRLKNELRIFLISNNDKPWDKFLLSVAEKIYTTNGTLTEHEKSICGVSNAKYQSLRYSL